MIAEEGWRTFYEGEIADRIVKHLHKIGDDAAAIHGNKTQGARERALERFRSGQVRVLVATDIAARGIDVPGITHVINFDLPNESESYVHRIGRTARAGREGTAISFCDTDERAYLIDIEKLIRQEVRVVEDHPFRSKTPFVRSEVRPPSKPKAAKRPARGGRRPARSRTRGRGRSFARAR